MSDKDSIWKEAIEVYFSDFLSFFFPQIGEDIDFGKGYEFLDKELKRIVHEAKAGKRYADVLVKVYLKDGKEKWILIHIEVQGYYDKEFEERMFIYNYRVFDRYKKEVISLAIPADPSDSFRPNKYEVSRWGFKHLFEFPIVKLIDYKERWAELEESKNPFAVFVMAHLKEIETNKEISNRFSWKVSLVKRLYEKGLSRRDILLLYKFIDWLISLPVEENNRFHEEITRFEEEKNMPYITTAERIGIEKGERIGIEKGLKEGETRKAQNDIIEVLETRFEIVPMKLIKRIKELREGEILSSLLKKAVLVKDLDEFEGIVNKVPE